MSARCHLMRLTASSGPGGFRKPVGGGGALRGAVPLNDLVPRVPIAFPVVLKRRFEFLISPNLKIADAPPSNIARIVTTDSMLSTISITTSPLQCRGFPRPNKFSHVTIHAYATR